MVSSERGESTDLWDLNAPTGGLAERLAVGCPLLSPVAVGSEQLGGKTEILAGNSLRRIVGRSHEVRNRERILGREIRSTRNMGR